ncbi:MAG: hypothetical protein HQK54_18280 [Oligoflexales bacterium]|nr:hypothetical protein [Oligoflexales bacterium]
MTINIISFDLTDRLLVHEFIEFPYRLYQGRYKWVPPLRNDLCGQLSTDENPFFRHGRARAFLCRKNGLTAGRLLAFIDYSLVASTQEHQIGNFGYFESENDKEVSSALLSNAEAWLESQGAKEIHGPIQFNIMNGYRIQTKGFDTTPFLGEPRNPPYYEELLTSAGYGRGPSWRSWELSGEDLASIVDSTAQKIDDSGGFTIKEMDFDDNSREMDSFYPLAQATFSENYGFSKTGLDEVASFFSPLLKLMGPECFFTLSDTAGKRVGYVFGYPDLAPALNAAGGDPAKFPEALRLNPPRRFLCHTIGILKEVRKTHAAYVLLNTIFSKALKNWGVAIGCLAKDGRTVYDMLGEASRSYHVFIKSLKVE